jgi:UDPglucose 6-dehydrogenase
MRVGIIGYGYVGSAVAASYPDDKIIINDPKFKLKSKSIKKLKEKCQAIFVCVPTPQSDTGECDTTILESVIAKLSGYEGIVIAKSTASPEVYADLESRYNLKLAHVPEFLTQARAKFDYVNPHKIVVGCREEIRQQVADVIMTSAVNFERVDIEYCSIQEASFFKYLANTQLAIKVVVNNEYADLAQQLGVKWERVVDIARTDYRLGATHWAVPGPDGARGFGGACFPKDTAALAHIANTNDIELTMLSTAISKNKLYRNKNGN